MKTHTIKTPTAQLLIVELSESGKIQSFSFEKKGFDGIAIIEKGKEPFLIKGYFTLLGNPDEIREEDAAEVVKSFQFGTDEHPYFRFLNYKTDYFHCFTAKESLLSLLESEIYWNVNPLSNEIHAPDIEEWHEAQEKTFDRNRSVIFKKKI